MLSYSQDIQPETEPNLGEEVVVFIEESGKHRVNAYIDGTSKFNKLYTFPWPTILNLCVPIDTRKRYVTGHF